MADNKKLKEVVDFYFTHGQEKTLETFTMKEDSLRRNYLDKYKALYDDFDKRKAILDISQTFTQDELQALAKGKGLGSAQVKKIYFDAEILKIGYITDTHFGSVFTDINAWEEIVKILNTCDIVIHTGDVTEGMSHRPRHVYELSHIGYSRQLEHSCEMLSLITKPLYIIDGNHDRWYIKSCGAKIVEEICCKIGAIFLGHDKGNLSINGITIRLFHGEDSSSYATSYRIQKLVEAMRGGNKPNVLLCGHTHKQGYFFERNIHCISGGAIQYQSSWMEGKRIQAHSGFHVINLGIGDCQVKFCEPRFYPLY